MGVAQSELSSACAAGTLVSEHRNDEPREDLIVAAVQHEHWHVHRRVGPCAARVLQGPLDGARDLQVPGLARRALPLRMDSFFVMMGLLDNGKCFES